jgi:hypothetical protein
MMLMMDGEMPYKRGGEIEVRVERAREKKKKRDE